MKKLLFTIIAMFAMTFAWAADANTTEVQSDEPTATDAISGTCRAKVIIIDSNGKRAYKPTIHVEFKAGSFSNSFKKFYGNEDGEIEVTWDESDYGSSVKCSMTIGTGNFTTTWTKSTDKFTMSDGGTYKFDVRTVGY